MKKNKLYGLIIAMVLVLLDLLTKYLTSTNIPHQGEVVIIKNFFWLTNVKNTGAAWSLFDGKVGLLTMISLIAVIALVIIYLRDQQSRWGNMALVLMMAGTFGNLYDRFFLNYVRDFLAFNIFGYHFPVFNLADSFLVIGVFILVLEVFISERNSSQ